MAIQGARGLREELAAIKKGKTRPVYLVFGSEGYLVRTSADAIVHALAEAGGAEVVRLDATGRPTEAVLEPVQALSLFASTRVVVVRGFTHLLAGESADRLLAGLDSGLGDGNAIVFVAPGDTGEKPDKRLRGTKGLIRRGLVVELNQQKREDLLEWLVGQARSSDKELAPAAAAVLLDRAGPDMQTLRTELDKALLYCLDQERIDASDLEQLVGKSREEVVWSVSEAAAAGEAARALDLLKDLLATGTYPLVILTLLARQARHMLQARLLWEEAGSPSFRSAGAFRSRVAPHFESGAFGGGADDVTTIHPFACFRRFEAATGHDVDGLRAMLARIRRCDRNIKTGRCAGDRQALEELILDLGGGSRGKKAA